MTMEKTDHVKVALLFRNLWTTLWKNFFSRRKKKSFSSFKIQNSFYDILGYILAPTSNTFYTFPSIGRRVQLTGLLFLFSKGSIFMAPKGNPSLFF